MPRLTPPAVTQVAIQELVGASLATGQPIATCVTITSMEHPTPIPPKDLAVYSPNKMEKSTIFRSERVMVGLNAFEPGQEHALHAHDGMDKIYHVIEGQGLFLLEGDDVPMQAGVLLVAPEGSPHGIRNTGTGRLLVLVILAPAP